MNTAIEKAFDFAQEVTKQLITLAIGVIALTVTFLTDVLENEGHGVGALQWAWILSLVSAAFGIAALLSMSGNLERPGSGKTPSIYARNIVVASVAQILTFLAALVLTIAFGFSVL